MFFTFTHLPIDLIKYIFTFLSGIDLYRLRRVEKHLCLVLKSPLVWESRLKQLRTFRQIAIATTPYRLEIQLSNNYLSSPGKSILLEEESLEPLKMMIIAVSLFNQRYPNQYDYGAWLELKLPDGTILNGDICLTMITEFLPGLSWYHERERFRLELDLNWGLKDPVYIYIRKGTDPNRIKRIIQHHIQSIVSILD